MPYLNAHADLLVCLRAIEDNIEVQERQLGGIAQNKSELKAQMVDQALAVAQATFALATDTGDTVLRGAVDYSRSDLLEGRDTVVGQRCQGVHAAANGVAAALVAYGVVAADLVALQAAIDAYVVAVSAPRTAITIRKGATEAIATLVREGLGILNDRMDKLMPEFEASAPNFYQEYFDARIIVDLGGPEEEEEPVPPTP